jgi:hypothetical protein
MLGLLRLFLQSLCQYPASSLLLCEEAEKGEAPLKKTASPLKG